MWLTGELRLERPTVANEIAWGLHFFREVLFDVMPQVLERLEYALKRHYPETPINVPAFFGFASWIGGDRDGNPGVTVATTARAVEEGRRAVIERFRQRLAFMVRTISISGNLALVGEAQLGGGVLHVEVEVAAQELQPPALLVELAGQVPGPVAARRVADRVVRDLPGPLARDSSRSTDRAPGNRHSGSRAAPRSPAVNGCRSK